MAIITIYQGASGSGQELAEAVAESLGYGCISREVLVEASLRYGIPEAKLNDIVEKEPNWWSRFLQSLQPYRIALQASFCEIAEGNGIVYHGHIGHELVPDLSHVLKVLLTAPMDMRIEQVKVRYNLNTGAAHRYVEEVDKARSRRLMAMFGTDWRDPSRFDLVLNLGRMSFEGARRLIIETVRSADYQMTPASKQAFSDFALAARVHAALVLSSKMSGAMLDVKAKEGEVSVSGTLPYWLSDDNVIEQIQKVQGVKAVRTDDLVRTPIDFGFGT
jgi:cytidylate kinase